MEILKFYIFCRFLCYSLHSHSNTAGFFISLALGYSIHLRSVISVFIFLCLYFLDALSFFYDSSSSFFSESDYGCFLYRIFRYRFIYLNVSIHASETYWKKRTSFKEYRIIILLEAIIRLSWLMRVKNSQYVCACVVYPITCGLINSRTRRSLDLNRTAYRTTSWLTTTQKKTHH